MAYAKKFEVEVTVPEGVYNELLKETLSVLYKAVKRGAESDTIAKKSGSC